MKNAALPAARTVRADMIPKSAPVWQQAMRDAVTEVAELLTMLELAPEAIDLADEALDRFPLRVPRSYLARMRKRDPNDPLLLQVLPAAAEEIATAGFMADPVGDLDATRGNGLLQKYTGRALLITTGACAIHCRYCFRRSFPYTEQTASRENWGSALEQLRNDDSIEEVILSGGDPLSLSDAKLAYLIQQLESIPHIQRLRIHTRQPIVLPERVDAHLLAWLSRTRLQTVMVLHCNHPQELSDDVVAAILKLRQAGLTLFNQAVLLKKINSNADVLIKLSKDLFKCGVIPYYLHQLDRVQGAGHFEVPNEQALAIHQQLRENLPGYMLSELVREIAGAPSKTPLIR